MALLAALGLPDGGDAKKKKRGNKKKKCKGGTKKCSKNQRRYIALQTI